MRDDAAAHDCPWVIEPFASAPITRLQCTSTCAGAVLAHLGGPAAGKVLQYCGHSSDVLHSAVSPLLSTPEADSEAEFPVHRLANTALTVLSISVSARYSLLGGQDGSVCIKDNTHGCVCSWLASSLHCTDHDNAQQKWWVICCAHAASPMPWLHCRAVWQAPLHNIHCGGVSALVMAHDESVLVSGARDGTLLLVTNPLAQGCGECTGNELPGVLPSMAEDAAADGHALVDVPDLSGDAPTLEEASRAAVQNAQARSAAEARHELLATLSALRVEFAALCSSNKAAPPGERVSTLDLQLDTGAP